MTTSAGSLPIEAARSWFQQRALLFKIFGVGFFGLVLLIPLTMVRQTLDERAARRAEAIDEITTTWGGTQQVVGPVLIVPFTHRVETEEPVMRGTTIVREKVQRVHTSAAYFLPDSLEVRGALETSERRRGIHRTDVYSAQVRITGRFARPSFAFTGAKEIEPQWNDALLSFGFSDLRGARGALQIVWNGVARDVEPGSSLPVLGPGVHVPVTLAADALGAEFALDLTLNGSGGFFVVPAGRTTKIHLESAWPDPSFAGAYLPTTRDVGAQGFSADWEVSYYGRNVPPQWANFGNGAVPTSAEMHAAALGVNLFEGVNAYRAVERAIKHGVLFIALVFAMFFLFEAFADVRLSGLNYLLIGAALCLFYLALLALSEFIVFGVAYAIAAVASVLLIGAYSRRILARRGRAALVTGMLGGVYAYLYFVLHMEDYALLAGTGALFALLAALMYATRRLGAATPALAPARIPPTG
jgi:inner membrane protein